METESKYIHVRPPREAVWALVIFLAASTLFMAAKLKNEIKGYNRAQPPTTITISGEGREFVKPDIGVVSVGVTKTGVDIGAVQQEVARILVSLNGFLDQQGVEEKDRKTATFSIAPQYDWTERGRIFRGYEVRQSMEIKIRDLAKVGAILTGAAQSGANEVGSLSFTIDDPKIVQAKAREAAIEDAKTKALALTKQLGVRLGRVVSFSESSGGSPPIPPYFAEARALGVGGTIETPVSVGENEIRAHVSVTYEIK